MAEITDEVLDRVAHIARLSLTPSERAALKTDLENILKTFSEIQQIKVGDEELYYVVDNVNPFRNDKDPSFCDPAESKCFEKDIIMKNIPEKEGKLVKVPRGL
jgi:aspartyl-tRNA(Asn)/glutamyl-tRNA(Gln) amidotransferase subunit C